ncbi:5442_t:CDS:10 [Funneliformis geosporum]|uniref:50_t:CDS:1 n=1 Tax=Funneliformis geosporum TaxID=1117311 RepID=A0A9W4WS86_9GLOM|nr:50_t:CDS:10 [Funneliformis geosporum]CAI2169117.1 5442_t:CDS:10 [Funneliformis geosporum]
MQIFSKKLKQQNTQVPWSQRKLSLSNLLPRHGHSTNQSGVNDELCIFGGIYKGGATNDVFILETNTFNVTGLTTTGDIPPPRSLHTQVNIGNNMIVKKQWYKPPMQDPKVIGRFGHSATVIGSKMYIFGGQSDGRLLNDLVVFDLQTLSSGVARWEFIVPLNDSPVGRTGHTMCAYNNKLFVFGGTDGERYNSDTWCYDTQTNKWNDLSCIGYLPAPRENHGVAIIEDVMYIFGGKGQDGLDLSDLGALKLSNQRWYMFSKMGIPPSPRRFHAMTASREKVLIFGGDCLQISKPDEDGTINILDTSKIKYPTSPSNSTKSSQITTQKSQQAQQIRSIPQQLQTGYSPPSQRSQSSLNSPVPSPRAMPDNMNVSNSSPRMGPQVGGGSPKFPKKTQNGSPRLPPDMVDPNNNAQAGNNLSSRGRSNSSEQRYNNYNNVMEGGDNRSLSPPLGKKQSFESLRKQTPSPTEGRREQFREGNKNATNLAMHMAGATGDFQNPRQAPRPPNSNSSSKKIPRSNNSSPSPLAINTKQLPDNSILYGGGSTISPSSSSTISQNSLKSPTFDALEHFPAPVSNTERDNFLRELQQRDVQISQIKKRENWLKLELALAKKSGYTPDNRNSGVPEGIDSEKIMDIGENGSDRFKIMSAVFKIRQELRREKATIANQAQAASHKITDAERARTAALQEAAYFKAKLTALVNASESDLASIEVKRAKDLEKRLTQALSEKESLQNKLFQLQQVSGYDKISREAAEERSKSATSRAEEAEEAHARALAELATLHSRATMAEAQLRENSTRLAEATSELSQYHSTSNNSRNKIDQLQQSLEQHQRALEKANNALLAANERAGEVESLWRQSRQDFVGLEKEAARLRADLDIRMTDLDRAHARANEMERLLGKSQKEVDAVRAMMQEGMTELLNTSRSNNEGNNSSEAAKKIIMLEQEISSLKSAHMNSQKATQETSSSLADAMIKISQMESAAIKARSDSASLQRRLIEASDENAKTKDKLREKEQTLVERTRALEDAEVKVGMMRDVLTEKGILDDGSNVNKGLFSSSRFKELESKCEELESKHNQAARKVKESEEKAKILEGELERASIGSKSLTSDNEDNVKLETKPIANQRELIETKKRLQEVENDYQTAVHYVKAQARNETLEEKLSEAENNFSVSKGLSDSKLQELTNQKLEEQRLEFDKEKVLLQGKVDDLRSQLDRAFDGKNMVEAEYDVLRKEYETLRKENESLRLIDQELRDLLKDSQEALRNTQSELDETLALYTKVNKELEYSMKSGQKVHSDMNWEEQRVILERQITDYRAMNERLEKENSDLEQKWRESENKITILLDQMEHAVDSYREIEDDIRDSSPRNSNVITSLTNELEMLKSQLDVSNQDIDLSDDEFINARWSRLPNDENDENDESRIPSRIDEYDAMMAALDEVQKTAAQRKLGNMGSNDYGSYNMTGNFFNNDDNNYNRNLNDASRNFDNSKKSPTRIVDQIRGQLNLTPPPTPPIL